MFDGDVHTFHVAQNAAALFLQGRGELLYFASRCMKEFVELFAEGRVVGSDRGQDSGMIKG